MDVLDHALDALPRWPVPQIRLGSDDADALNCSMERGIFVERAMNSRRIIIGNILPKDPTQMRLPKQSKRMKFSVHIPVKSPHSPSADMPSHEAMFEKCQRCGDVVAGTMEGTNEARAGSANEMGFDHFLVPVESYSRHIGYVQEPVLDLVGPLENWIGPILPL
jgi:hypothetical protein